MRWSSTTTRSCQATAAALMLFSQALPQMGIGSSRLHSIATGPTRAYFAATDGVSGMELWRTTGSGTTLAAALAADVLPGKVGSAPMQLVLAGNGTAVWFTASTAAGRELHYFDGTDAIAARTPVADLHQGQKSSNPAELTVIGDRVFYTAVTSTTSGRRLFMSVKTSQGFQTTQLTPAGLQAPRELTVCGGKLVFVGRDAAAGDCLRIVNSTWNGFNTVDAVAPGPGSSHPTELTSAPGNRLFFAARRKGVGREVWELTLSPPAVARRTDIRTPKNSQRENSDPTQLTVGPAHVAFSALHPTRGRELFVLPLAGGGDPVVLSDLPLGHRIAEVTAWGTEFGFRAETAGKGAELWRTKIGSSTIARVTDLMPGQGSSKPTGLVYDSVTDRLLFRATDPVHGPELRAASASSVTLVKNIRPDQASATLCKGSFPCNPVRLGNDLLFSATNGFNGIELWRTKLASGWQTGMVHNIHPNDQAVPELHLDVTPSEVRGAICGQPSRPALIAFGLPVANGPLILPGVRGSLIVAPTILLIGTTDATGVFGFQTARALVPPTMIQGAVFDANLRLELGGNGTYSGQTTTCFSAVTVEAGGIVCDDNGIYDVDVERTSNETTEAWVLMIRVDEAGNFLESYPETLCPLPGPGGILNLSGQVPPLAPEYNNGVKHSLEIYMILAPSTEDPQPPAGSGCKIWLSYC